MRALVSLVAALQLVSGPVTGQDTDTARLQRLYAAAVGAAERREIPLAITLMDSVVRSDSSVLDAWWNLGIWQASLGRAADALRAWQTYHAMDSTDWRVEAKLIQSYQALNDLGHRDSALAGLLRHRASTQNADLRTADVFCREQATVNGHRVMVMQTFVPDGDRMVFFTFHLLSPDGRSVGRYSLGSYDLTTRAAREAGEIGTSERIYHIDYYGHQQHSSIAFYRAMPTYDTVREVVWNELRLRSPQ